jgi:D-lactate dehydrogenase
MKIALFYAKAYERPSLDAENARLGHHITYIEAALQPETAPLAAGHDAVCIFVNDQCSGEVIGVLARGGVRLILCRSAGFNHVDLTAAAAHGMTVMRVPAYSPESVAEHTVAMVLSLIRHMHHQYARVRNGNYGMDGLVGFTLHGKTAGICGTGKIGLATARILKGFGCRLLGNDPYPSEACTDLGMEYVERDVLFTQSDVVILTAPLTPETKHMVNAESLKRFKKGSVLVNTGRGALVDTRAAIEAAMKTETLWYLGMDVYEDEAGKFFENMAGDIVQDETLLLLTNLKNVLVTPHSAFLTRESLAEIAAVTLGNATAFEQGRPDPAHLVKLD